MKDSAVRGRPRQSDREAQERAAWIIDAAHAFLQGNRTKLTALGVTPSRAKRLISTRHRGKVGACIGDTLDQMLAARGLKKGRGMKLRLAADAVFSGVPLKRAAAVFQVDERTLRRSMPAFQSDEEKRLIRVAQMNMRFADAPVGAEAFSANSAPTR